MEAVGAEAEEEERGERRGVGPEVEPPVGLIPCIALEPPLLVGAREEEGGREMDPAGGREGAGGRE